MKILRLFIATMLVTLGLNGASKMDIDGAHSHVTFKIKHLMISNVIGEFKKFNGEITADLKEKTFEKFVGTISADSIDTGIEKRDDHLKSPDFFDVAKYPEIKFVMKSYKKSMFGDEGVMIGDLTLHGVTKELKLGVTMSDPVNFKGIEKVGVEMSGKIDRKDFGLTWNKAIETGGVVVGDEVKITIELELEVDDLD